MCLLYNLLKTWWRLWDEALKVSYHAKCTFWCLLYIMMCHRCVSRLTKCQKVQPSLISSVPASLKTGVQESWFGTEAQFQSTAYTLPLHTTPPFARSRGGSTIFSAVPNQRVWRGSGLSSPQTASMHRCWLHLLHYLTGLNAVRARQETSCLQTVPANIHL